MMDSVVPTSGVLLHACEDWPCAMCRPTIFGGKGGNFLCLDCAHKLVASSFSKSGPNAPWPGTLEDAVAFLEAQEAELKPDISWDFLKLRDPDKQ